MLSNSCTRYLSALFLFIVSDAETLQTWSSKDGRTMQAAVECIEEDEVIFSRSGKTFAYPIDQLSAESITLLNSLKEEPKADERVPVEGKSRKFGVPITFSNNYQESWSEKWSSPKFELTNPSSVEHMELDESVTIFESPHFRILSEFPLNKSSVGYLGENLETRYSFSRQLPISLPDFKNSSQDKIAIILGEVSVRYKSREVEAEVTPRVDQAPQRGFRLVRRPPVFNWQNFPEGLKRGESVTVLKKKLGYFSSSDVISRILADLNGYETEVYWLSNGLAEYLDLVEYDGEKADASKLLKAVIECAEYMQKRGKSYTAQASNIYPGELIKKLHFNDMLPSTDHLLAFYYLLHVDDDGSGEPLKNFMMELRNGASLEEAEQVLLNGRTLDQLSEEYFSFWKTKRITQP